MRALQQRGRQLDPRALPLLRSTRRRAKQHAGPFPRGRPKRALFGSTSLLQRARCYQPSNCDRLGTLCPTKPAGQVTAICSQESSTATARPTKVKRQTCGWQAGVWWRTRAPGSPLRSPERCRSSSKILIAELVGLFMFLRNAHAPVQYVTDNSFVEQDINQRGRKATEVGGLVARRLVRDRCLGRLGRHPLSAQR